MKEDVIQLCRDQSAATYRTVNALYRTFLREIANVDYHPAVNSEAMIKLEDAIDNAVAAGDLQKTENLCDEYTARFAAYLDKWRKIAARAKGAAA